MNRTPGIRISVAALFVIAAAVPGTASALTEEQEVVELVNQERWANGQLPPLKHNALLDNSSESHSQAMADRDFFAHCDLDLNTLPWDRMIAAGYSYNSAAENIAAGYSSPAAVMNGWMNSSGHRANILSANLREIGVGYVYQNPDAGNIRTDSNSDCAVDGTGNGPYYRYWTQNFGKKNTVYPVIIERETTTVDYLEVDLYVYGAGWATEMRFKNETGSWSLWQPFSANAIWTLSPGDGLKTVSCEITNGSSVRLASDDIEVSGAAVTAVPEARTAFTSSLLTLFRAYPNPTQAASTVAFTLNESSSVRVTVFDIVGREVAALAEGQFEPGRHELRWSGDDPSGRRMPPGIYFVRVIAGGFAGTTRVILAR